MHFKFKKNLKIINELITYFHKLEIKNINFNFDTKSAETLFIIWGEIETLAEKKLDNIIHLLSNKRQHEIEEYYWNLPSDYNSESQLSIIGMMVDSFEVIYDNNILTIRLSRIED